MPGAPEEFQYALLRVVPRLERGEAINAGVVLFCRRKSFLAARVRLDRSRLAALDRDADADAVERHPGPPLRVPPRGGASTVRAWRRSTATRTPTRSSATWTRCRGSPRGRPTPARWRRCRSPS